MAVSVNESVGLPLDSEVAGIGSNGMPVYSNQYTSADYRNVLSKFFKNGVFSNSALSVVPHPLTTSGLRVAVTEGSAMVNGAMFTLTKPHVEFVSLPIVAADTSYYIGVIVVVRLDTSNANETMSLEVKRGEPVANKGQLVYPTMTRTDDVYEIELAKFCAQIHKSSNGAMSADTIFDYEDTRLIPEFCGLATPYVQFDTTAFSQELDYIVEETDIRANELLAQANSRADAAIDNLNEKTETAVQLAADALDETVAGSIYNRLEDLETDVRPIELGGTDSDTPLGASLTLSFPSLAFAKKIPANADLDNYGAIGSFATQNSADVATMHNVPDGVTSAFRLYVSDLTGIEHMDLWRQQFLIEYNTLKIYARHNNPNTGFWSKWIQYARESDTGLLTPLSDLTQVRYRIKNGLLEINFYHAKFNVSSVPSGRWVTIFTLPANHRPSASRYCTGAVDEQFAIYYISASDGQVQVKLPSPTAGEYVLDGDFMVIL